jgi:hypothetical protein
VSKGPPWTFFVLVFVLSIPFWVIGARMEWQWLPGLPVAALAVVCPATAAVMLQYRDNGSAGVKTLLERTLDYKKIEPVWYAPIVLLIPGVTVQSYALMWTLKMPPGASVVRMDCVVVFQHSLAAGSARLALQQHRQERLRGDPDSRHQQSVLATLSERRFALGPADRGPTTALAAAVVIIVSGPRALTRFRSA